VKKTIIFRMSAVLLALLFSATLAQAAESLKIGPDGYGKTTLANGITVVVNQDKTTSLSAARILIGGGVLCETAADNGISNLTVKMLLKGNGTMTAAQISDRLDFLGASVSADCFRDYSAVSISCLTENFDKVLEIISASLAAPSFPVDELTKLKSEVDGQIKAASDNQTQASSDLFWRTAYGDQGYGLPVLGRSETIARLTADDLKTFYHKWIGGKNIVVAMATDLPVVQIASIIDRRLGPIRPEAEQLAKPTLVLQTEKTGFLSFDRNQSFVFMGYVLDRLEPKEIACLGLLNQVMGGPVGSRLWDLRQKEKLAYAVYTQWQANNYSTVLRAAIGTDTTKVKQALSSLDREWSKLLAEGITEQEMSDARVNMKNSLIYGIDRKAVRANNMAFYEYLGYGYKFLSDEIAMADQATISDVNSFVKTKLTSDRKYLSIVGKR
jgi:zinc protease